MRTLLPFLALIALGCADKNRRAPLGASCSGNDQCGSGVCGGGSCLAPAGDDDLDGLINSLEAELGSNPVDVDSDHDGVPDGEEVSGYLAPTDTDGDGKSDILESRTADADDDCISDEVDADDARQDTDLSPMIVLVCRREGLCAMHKGRLAITCATGTATCRYDAIEGYADDEYACDGVDENCDGERDEGFVDSDGDGLADCVDPDSPLRTAPVVSITPAVPTTQSALQGVVTRVADLAYMYRWFKDTVDAGIAVPTVGPDLTHRDEVWRLEVSASDGVTTSPVGSAEVRIANSPPTCVSAILLPVQGDTDTAFTCRCDRRADADDDAPDDACDFEAEGRTLATVPAEGGVCTLDPIHTGRGDAIRCRFHAGDGTDIASFDSLVLDVGNARPPMPVVALAPNEGGAETVFTCTASATAEDPDGDDVRFDYTWVVNDHENPGVTTSLVRAHDLVAADGHYARRGDRILCRVRADDGYDTSSPADTVQVVLDNTAPQGGSALIEPAVAVEGTTLTCVAGDARDVDGDAIAWTYAWEVDGARVDGQTLATLGSAHFDRGQEVRCVATPGDGTLTGEPVTSKNSVRIGNTPPSVARAVVSPIEAARSEVLMCAFDGWSDPDPADSIPAVGYAWFVGEPPGGVEIAGAFGPTLSPSGLAPGDVVYCRVTPQNPGAPGAPVTSGTARVVNLAPSMTSVVLGPASAYGDSLLTCTAQGAPDRDGDAVTLAYEWLRNGQPIAGATGPTLSGAFVKGDSVRCGATPADPYDVGDAVLSNALLIGNSLPVIRQVALTPTSGTYCATFTCDATSFTDPDPGDTVLFSYRWTRNGLALADTGRTLLANGRLRPGDTLRCFMRPSDGTLGAGQQPLVGAEVASAPATVFNTPPLLSAVVITPSTPAVGERLTCNPSGFSDPECAPTPQYEFRWFDGTQLIAGATAPTLETTTLPGGASIACQATPFDGYDRGTAKLSSPVQLTNEPPSAAVVVLQAPNGAAGSVTCSLSTPALDEEALSYTWHWQIGDAAPFVGGASLAAGQVGDCDRIRCWADASDGLAMTTSNVAELILPFGADCDDGNVCTSNACAAGGGCATTNNTTSCADADLCDGSETCQGGTCQPGVPIDCGGVTDVCLQQACNPATGQCNLPVADDTPCPDSDPCDGTETCQSGVCSSGAPIDCSAVADPCLQTTCNPSTGACDLPQPDETPCEDATVCDGAETCQAGICTEGSTLVCDDGDPCTGDSCDAVSGCQNPALPEGTACTLDDSACVGFGVCESSLCEVRWLYRRPIAISGAASAQTGYVVPVDVDTAALIADGKMRADAGDVRFVSALGVALPWWIESGLNTSATRLWVRVDLIPTSGTTVYLRYGNPDATTGTGVNDGLATFDMFDDFEDGVLDPARWTAGEAHPTRGLATLPDETGGKLRFPLPGPCCGSAGWRNTETAVEFTGSRAIEFNMSMNNAPVNPNWKSSIWVMSVVADGRVWAWGDPLYGPFALVHSGWWSNDVGHCAPVNGAYLARALLDLDAGTFALHLGATLCHTVTGVVIDVPYSFNFEAVTDGALTVEYSDFRVRAYVSPEPVAGAPGAEELCGPPVDAWAVTTALPRPRYDTSSVVHNGRLYVIGGSLDGTASVTDDVLFAAIGSYGQLGAWTATTAVPFPRAGATSVVANGYLYVLGGADYTTGQTTRVEVGQIGADGTIGSWSSVTALPSPRMQFASLVYNGRLYAIGGNYGHGYVNWNDVQVAPILANGALGAWTATTSFARERHLHSAFAYDDHLYVLAGSSTGAIFETDVQVAPIFADGTVGSWSATTSLSSPIVWHASSALDGYAYVIGGNVGGGAANCSDRVDVAPILAGGGLGAWSATTSMPTCRAAFGHAVHDGFFYVVGGLKVDEVVSDVIVWSAHP